MKFAFADAKETDWREILDVATGLGLPLDFNLEWLVDQAERGEWSGLWW